MAVKHLLPHLWLTQIQENMSNSAVDESQRSDSWRLGLTQNWLIHFLQLNQPGTKTAIFLLGFDDAILHIVRLRALKRSLKKYPIVISISSSYAISKYFVLPSEFSFNFWRTRTKVFLDLGVEHELNMQSYYTTSICNEYKPI